MNKIFIISGPSGVGKGTIIKDLLKKPELNLCWARSYTTRPKRPSDNFEYHYIFLDEKKFKKLEKQGEILEKNFYNGNWYGSSKSEIDNVLKNNKNVLQEIEVNGAMNYRKLYPDAILIFIKADLDDIKNRLISRGQNTAEQIETRLKIARRETKHEKDYDYSVTNPENHPEKAIGKVEKIIKRKLS